MCYHLVCLQVVEVQMQVVTRHKHQVKVHLSTLQTDVLNVRYAPAEVEFLLEKE